MISICSIRNVKPEDYDEVWAIVRSLKSKSPWIKHVPELSPSMDLFMKYRRLVEKSEWNENTFQTVYVPQFLQEMHNPLAKARFEELKALDAAGKNIALICFCPRENLCHRSIIAGILQGDGIRINTERGINYAAYHSRYDSLNA